ncbi:ATP-binding protein [Streptosporangium sp. H16]|uniref:ATP-binding protein n=1 Tax=Streptosporangium sp. H16 TaxID=3444184 RepID=UPI003F79D752
MADAVDGGLAEGLGPEAAAALARWAGQRDLAYTLDRWFVNGATSAVVALVNESDTLRRRSRKLVLKFDVPDHAGSSEYRRQRRAVLDAPEFARRHLAELIHDPVAVGEGGWIVFQRIAGRSVEKFHVMSSLVRGVIGAAPAGGPAVACDAEALAGACGRIFNAILSDWTIAPYRVELPVPEFLELHLHGRTGPGRPLRSTLLEPLAGLEAAGPVAELLDSGLTVPALLGRCHADLTVENLLVRVRPELEPTDFRLIDLAKYQAEGPLARDPILFLLHLAVRFGGEGIWAGGALVEAVSDPATPRSALLPRWYHQILTRVHDGVDRWIEESGFDGDWRAQAHLSTLAVAVRLLGRRSTTAAHRPWLARLAVRSAATYLESRSPGSGTPAGGPVEPLVVPRQLPAGTRLFIGRGRSLAELDELVAGPPPALVVVHGTAGVGKTTLALHWANAAAGRFPDGQLHADLRGFDASAPRGPEDVLHGFLRALDVAEPDVPGGLDAKAALYRSLLARRRMLVLLDNARDGEQVRPLLPGGSSACAVVITSRDRLDTLVAREGGLRVALDRLERSEAVELVRARFGTGADPGAAAELAELCARLPLALTIATAGATASSSVERLAGELRDERTRLLMLARGPDLDLRSVFSWSYHRLPPEAALLYRLLGVHPGRSVTVPVAAALCGVDLVTARRGIETLVRVNLLEEATPGRYVLHDLLYAYAVGLADALVGAAERVAVLRRLYDYYLGMADRADRVLTPHRYRVPLDIDIEWARGGPAVATYAAALGWFDEECQNLEALCRSSVPGTDRECWQLAYTLRGYFFLTKRCEMWIRTHRSALAATRRIPDRHAEALTLNNLGLGLLENGEEEDAEEHYRLALLGFRESGDRHGESTALANLSWIAHYRGRHGEALRQGQAALDFYRLAGSSRNAAITMRGMALFECALGRHRDAVRHLREALEVFAELDLGLDETMAWNALGEVLAALDESRDAVAAHQRALAAARSCGSRHEEARAHHRLGRLALDAGDPGGARDHWARAQALAQQPGLSAGTADQTASITGTPYRRRRSDGGNAPPATA